MCPGWDTSRGASPGSVSTLFVCLAETSARQGHPLLQKTNGVRCDACRGGSAVSRGRQKWADGCVNLWRLTSPEVGI